MRAIVIRFEGREKGRSHFMLGMAIALGDVIKKGDRLVKTQYVVLLGLGCLPREPLVFFTNILPGYPKECWRKKP